VVVQHTVMHIRIRMPTKNYSTIEPTLCVSCSLKAEKIWSRLKTLARAEPEPKLRWCFNHLMDMH
ncbi:unnamed protein product, partial [Allacma fusca]